MEKTRDIIILGSGAGWHLCPFDKDKEVWMIAKMVLNKTFNEMKHSKVDRLFSIDDTPKMLSWDKNSAFKTPYSMDDFVKAINESGAEFITSYCYPDMKKCMPFPLKEIVEHYGIFYFTNTVCFMLAYALWLGDVRSVTLWGVNQTGSLEYFKERKGVEFWMGLLAGMGVELRVEGPSQLLQAENKYIYGYKKTTHELKDEFNIDIEL